MSDSKPGENNKSIQSDKLESERLSVNHLPSIESKAKAEVVKIIEVI